MYNQFNIKNNIIEYVNNAEKMLQDDFKIIESIYENNQLKILESFIKLKISESDFQESTGYGYTDVGRDKIESLYADIFDTEDALVRQQIVSGTHAIAIALFALTKPNDNIISICGLPYDTIRATIGLNNETSSLKENNINFDYVDLINNDFDYESIKKKINSKTKLVMIQRSRGYSERNALSIKQISDVISFIKKIDKNIIILVDNCYGEFVDTIEPTNVDADIMCGSLIKNPGGSLVKTGGYIVGKKDLIEKCSYRLTAPGIGKEVGVNFNQNRNVLQGLFFSPQIVSNTLKIIKLFSYVYNKLDFDTIPSHTENFNDIVLAIKLKNETNLKMFCKSIQESSPVDSFVKPIENEMPGYDNKIIMACGSFISGSSIELSCDAPLKEPYIAYLQGGISYYQGKLALMNSIQNMNL